ncbi:MAG: sulfur oxidation c-type cytochrome SoxX [Cytophagales bacterium]|nr:sulfur oxidation c-type cytochrome SoxX [Cytophagales bacterium]
MMKLTLALSLMVIGLAAHAQAAKVPSNQEIVANLKDSFNERGIAKLDRLDQTELQKACSQAAESGKPLPAKVKARIEKKVLASIPYPADGVYLGDWKEGEKIAQNGRGLQFSDAAGAPNGANCYACHQLTPTEISFGNQGPSLLKYGTLRGVKDPAAKDSEAIVKYTWARIWNTHAFNACNGMPRFGDAGILTPAQIKDVMALLLDPASPVNK